MRKEFIETGYGNCCEPCSEGLPCSFVPTAYRRPPLEHDENMSGLWRDFKDAVSDVARVVKKVVVSPAEEFVSKTARLVKTGVIQKIDSIEDLRYIASKGLIPQSYVMELVAKVPVLDKLTGKFDRLSGNTYSDMKISLNIPGKAVRGERITPYELAVAIQTGVKVGVIAASGGSAASIIGVVSGQLKRGSLGETEKGRKLLGIAEIAGYAAAAGQSIGNIAADQAEKKAISEVEKAALSKTNLGKSYLGRTLVQVGGNVYTDGESGITNFATDYAKSQAVEKLPNGRYLVKYGPYVYRGITDDDFFTKYPTVDDMIAKAQLETAREIKKIQQKGINKVEEFPQELRSKIEAAVTAEVMRKVAEAEGLLLRKLLGQGKTPEQIKDEIIRRQRSPIWQRYLKNKKAIDTGLMVLAGGGTMALVAASLKKQKQKRRA